MNRSYCIFIDHVTTSEGEVIIIITQGNGNYPCINNESLEIIRFAGANADSIR